MSRFAGGEGLGRKQVNLCKARDLPLQTWCQKILQPAKTTFLQATGRLNNFKEQIRYLLLIAVSTTRRPADSDWRDCLTFCTFCPLPPAASNAAVAVCGKLAQSYRAVLTCVEYGSILPRGSLRAGTALPGGLTSSPPFDPPPSPHPQRGPRAPRELNFFLWLPPF